MSSGGEPHFIARALVQDGGQKGEETSRTPPDN